MKKLINLSLVIAALVLVFPVAAKNNQSNLHREDNRIVEATVPTTPGCDPKDFTNHGGYVSCVAHLHIGGRLTSEAARLDFDKHRHHPSSTPSATPVPTPPATSPVTSPETNPPHHHFDFDEIFDRFFKVFDFFNHHDR